MSNKLHLHRAFSGVPQQGGQDQKRLHSPCLFAVPMLEKDRCGYVTPCYPGVPNSGERPTWLHHPCLLKVPMVGIDQYGYIIPAFLGITIVGKDQTGYITLAFSGIPNRRDKIRSGWTIPALLEARENAQNKFSILNVNTLGDLFYRPLQMGHQNFPSPAVPANFSRLACTMVETIQTFWPPRGGAGGVRDCTWAPPVEPYMW